MTTTPTRTRTTATQATEAGGVGSDPLMVGTTIATTTGTTTRNHHNYHDTPPAAAAAAAAAQHHHHHHPHQQHNHHHYQHQHPAVATTGHRTAGTTTSSNQQQQPQPSSPSTIQYSASMTAATRMSQILDDNDHKRCTIGNQKELLQERIESLRTMLLSDIASDAWKYEQPTNNSSNSPYYHYSAGMSTSTNPARSNSHHW